VPDVRLIRIDVEMVKREIASSRTEAQRLIAAGQVTVDGLVVVKANRPISPNSSIVLSGSRSEFVSRGGNKLAAALRVFNINPAGRLCLDIGISTGGFTDCLLQAGATKVVGIDVGHDQLHAKLRSDARVELREGVNARAISPTEFSEQFSLITVDVSFISLTLVIPRLPPLLTADGWLICLIKPQFEVGAGRLGKNGVVVDDSLRIAACNNVNSSAINAGLDLVGTIDSPITGGDGNKEYLSVFRHCE